MRVGRASCIALAALLGVAAAGAAEDDPFPLYDGLTGQVEFWKRVFTEWSLDQVAVHDLDHPAVVYDVVSIPGPPVVPYTAEQRDSVEKLRESWEARLAALEAKIEAGATLDDGEKALVLKLTTQAGTDAVRGASARLRTQRGLRERFKRGLEISGRYLPRFREIFRAAGLPEDLAYLPHVESSFQADARSSAGAVGIWQFTRGAGRRYLVVSSTLDERLDPVAAARGAARYLRDAHDALGHWPLALTSYNHGVEGMKKAREQFGTDFVRMVREYQSRSFGFASKNFYAEFLAAREIAASPERFFPEGLRLEPPLAEDEVVLDRAVPPARIASSHGTTLGRLASLNPAWTSRAVRRGEALPAGTRVWLPAGTLARRAPPAAPAGGGETHVVRKGETLSSIASAHGIDVAELRRLNGLAANSSLIRVGQSLRVRPRQDAAPTPGGTHVVRWGDTLSRIATAYGVRLADLLRLNQLTPQAIIRPGQRIHIPAAR